MLLIQGRVNGNSNSSGCSSSSSIMASSSSSDQSSSSRPSRRRTCSCSPSNHSGAFRCSLHRQKKEGGERLKRSQSADRVLLKRALVPPVRKFVGRCWNFRPTPSRLSNMSTA